MKILCAIFGLLLCFACSDQQQHDGALVNSAQAANKLIPTSKPLRKSFMAKTRYPIRYLVSTYDNPLFADRLKSHKETLRQLSKKNVFSRISAMLRQKLEYKHQYYFKYNPNYELLWAAQGDLFQENKNDCAFVVYDKKYQRVSILVYNELTNQYVELFRGVRVENGLQTADCNYSSFGTLDYQLAEEIVSHQEVYLKEKPEHYLEYAMLCKIVDLSKDEDFVLPEGCFSPKLSESDFSSSLCISTSVVYNNWECLRYHKETNTFFIFYGQAFAD
jgi:hypothetical protein